MDKLSYTNIIAIAAPVFLFGAYVYRTMFPKDYKAQAVGMRRPGTEIGSWEGAYVAVLEKDGKITAAYFENKKDYIGHPKDWGAVMKEYHALQFDRHWMVMSNVDLQKTAGVSADGSAYTPPRVQPVSTSGPSVSVSLLLVSAESTTPTPPESDNECSSVQSNRSEHETENQEPATS
jgi:hypothetical protein